MSAKDNIPQIGDSCPTTTAAAIRQPVVVQLGDGRYGVTVEYDTLDLGKPPGPQLRQMAINAANRETPCPDCNGTGVYRGLLSVEPCRTCRKAGAGNAPGIQ
jgi:ribosomal protein L37AE/L43A